MKDIGIVGMPYSGKSTLFTALTRHGAAGGRANQAVVDVPDERVGALARLAGSDRAVHAKVRFVDVPGGLTAQGIGEFRTTDALCVVVRAFGPDSDPAAELRAVRSELVLADLASIDGALDKAAKRAAQSKEAAAQLAVLERARAVLEDERFLRDEDLVDADLKLLRGFAPLTLKPHVVVANVAEGGELPQGLPEGAIAVSAGLEAEVAGMEADEAAELLEGFGIKEPGLGRVIASCYAALDLITFLTATEDETRAWELRRGATAPEAAGVVHSDMQRGFIRAEVVGYADLVAAGSWEEARSKGILRIEGKDYVVQEGDVLRIRFAV